MRFGSREILSGKFRSNLQIKQQRPGHSFSGSSSPPPSSPNSIPLPASSYSVVSDKASKQKHDKSRQKGPEKSAKAEPQTEVAALSSIPAGFTTIRKASDKRRCLGFLDPAHFLLYHSLRPYFLPLHYLLMNNRSSPIDVSREGHSIVIRL